MQILRGPASLALTLTLASAAAAQTDAPTFGEAALSIEQELVDSVAELEALQQSIVDRKLPLAAQLTELERERSRLRAEYEEIARSLDTRRLDLTTIGGRIERLEKESAYLSNLLVDYVQGFDASLHVAERQRYAEVLEAARRAPENDALTPEERFADQTALLDRSIVRLLELAGGTRFDGSAVGPDGLVDRGTFAVVGPLALFRSVDGTSVGTAETRIGSDEPRVIAFDEPEDSAAAAALVATGSGTYPVDTTLGNAYKIAATDESLLGELEKGGMVIWPILGLAALALLTALYKWITLALVREPSRRDLAALVDAVAAQDDEAAAKQARRLRGPVGRMLAAGVEHLQQPRELIEEAMYETVLTTRLRLNSLLPFIAICAASAPLLGLLGTVTGIINTFKQIQLFGSGDVKMLSGGISEALITTKYGLIVAIPSLLLHAFLARKARSIVGRMETAAVSFMNAITKAPSRPSSLVPRAPAEAAVAAEADPELVRRQVAEVLEDLLGPLVDEANGTVAKSSSS